MDRRTILKNIADRYKQCVIEPANPFTVDNPDALIFNGHALVGLYIPLAKEVKNPDLLLRRLFFSRLAMCNSVSTVLLLTKDFSIQLANNTQIASSFDYVHVFEGIPNLLRLLADGRNPIHLIDKRLKQENMKRFWGTLDFFEKNKYLIEEYSSLGDAKGMTATRWSTPGSKRISKRTSYNEACIITSKEITKQSFKEGYEDIMTFAAMYNYSLTDGVLKRITDSNEHCMFLNIESLETVMRNEINLRTMVFLGYLPWKMNEDTDIKKINDRYYSFMREGKYW